MSNKRRLKVDDNYNELMDSLSSIDKVADENNKKEIIIDSIPTIDNKENIVTKNDIKQSIERKLINAKESQMKAIQIIYNDHMEILNNIIADIEESIKDAVEGGELQCVVSIKKYTDKRFEDFFDEDIKYIIDILEGMEYKVIAQWSLTSIDTMKILIDWKGELN